MSRKGRGLQLEDHQPHTSCGVGHRGLATEWALWGALGSGRIVPRGLASLFLAKRASSTLWCVCFGGQGGLRRLEVRQMLYSLLECSLPHLYSGQHLLTPQFSTSSSSSESHSPKMTQRRASAIQSRRILPFSLGELTSL